MKDCIQYVLEETLRGSHCRFREAIDIPLATTRFCRIDALNGEVNGCLRERLKTLPINDNNVPRALVFESNIKDSDPLYLEPFLDG